MITHSLKNEDLESHAAVERKCTKEGISQFLFLPGVKKNMTAHAESGKIGGKGVPHLSDGTTMEFHSRGQAISYIVQSYNFFFIS